MAIGFTPKHTEEYILSELTVQQYIALAADAAESLKWKIFDISRVGFKAGTNNGFLSANQLIKFRIIDNVIQVESSSIGTEMIDFGKNKKNVKKLMTAIDELHAVMPITELDQKYDSFKLIEDEFDDLQQPTVTASENFRSFFSIFVPSDGYFITPVLINLNILIFVVMAFTGVNIFEPDNDSLIRWGANFKPMTLDGQPWRLITNCFLHVGVFHLLLNMYALMYIGVLLEPYLGKIRFTAAYLLTGITASVTSLWWHDLTISAGASGAIFGMYGVFLALLTTNLIHKDIRKGMLTSIAFFTGYNLLFGMKSGIDNAAHIGGLLSGMAVGYAFLPSLRNFEVKPLKYITITLLSILLFSTSFVIYNNSPNNIAEYESRIKPFHYNESMALEIYQLPENTAKAKLLYEIKDRGIYYWNENIKLLKSVDSLEIPDILHERNEMLRNYCELRIKAYELLYKAVDEDNHQKYQQEIEAYNKQVDDLINSLKGKGE